MLNVASSSASKATRKGPVKKATAVSLLVITLLGVALAPTSAEGWHRHRGVRTRVFVGFGPSFWWGPPYPHWWYYPPAYVYSPPPIVVEEPPVYIQKPAVSYWYYCPSAKAYYPMAPTCPEAWIKVPPRTN